MLRYKYYQILVPVLQPVVLERWSVCRLSGTQRFSSFQFDVHYRQLSLLPHI